MIEIIAVRNVTEKKKVWTEEQIKYLIQTNDEVLYRALRKLYGYQTEIERQSGNTQESNGVGFNAYDAPFLSAIYKSLEQYGHLTKGQKEKTRNALIKYNKQLTKIANHCCISKIKKDNEVEKYEQLELELVYADNN